MSEEDLEAAKQRSKTSLNRFGEGLETKPKPFPWGAAALAGLVFLIATPFALRAYRRTASEISGNRSFGDSRRGE